MTQKVSEFRSLRHRHTFHALWFHLGPFGRQDVHVHPCLTQECARVLIGEGRECESGAPHHRETLS